LGLFDQHIMGYIYFISTLGNYQRCCLATTGLTQNRSKVEVIHQLSLKGCFKRIV
jgi:hypothetical protein